MNNYEESLLFAYLLGELPQREREAVESRLFEDDNLIEHLEAAETELVRDYLHGDLSGSRGRSFHRALGRSPHLRRKVEFLRALVHAVEEVNQDTRTPFLWSRLFPSPLPLKFAVAWAIAALVISPTIWLTEQSMASRARLRVIETQTEITARHRPRSDDAAVVPARAVSVVLTPGIFRGNTTESARLALSASIKKVELQLVVARGVSYQEYRAKVTSVDAGICVWSEQGMSIRQISGFSRLVMVVDAAVLPRADYLVALEGSTGDQNWVPIHSYLFRVNN